MFWSNKKKDNDHIKKQLFKTRQEVDEKLKSLISIESAVELIEAEIIEVGTCWTTLKEGIEINKPSFPYNEKEVSILTVNAKKGATIKPHIHTGEETIHIITGEHKNLLTGKVNKAGEVIKIDKGETHGSKFLKDSILIVQWKPKNKNENSSSDKI